MSWEINPNSGDYVMTSGEPTDSDDIRYNAYIRLKVRRSTWLYAPDSEYGSDFHLIKKRKTNGDASVLESIASRALRPILNDGRATDIEVNTVLQFRNAVGMNIKITTPKPEVKSFVFKGLDQ